MAGDAAVRTGVSVEEYVAFERAASSRHLLWRGEIFAMAGGSIEHAMLIANVTGVLLAAARGGRCRAYSSDLKLYVPLSEGFVYPDATVVCGPVVPHANDPQSATNPALVVEVLSPTTESFDRGEKFEGYRTVATLIDYVLVAQSRAHIEHYARRDDGVWELRDHGIDGTLELRSLGASVEVREIYDGLFVA
ncbi:MAG: Uma2 family endonuclease [Polyangiales bacterium]